MLDFTVTLTNRALYLCHCWYRPSVSFLTESRTAEFHLVSLESLAELWGAQSFAAEPQVGWDAWHSFDENRLNFKVSIWHFPHPTSIPGSVIFILLCLNSFAKGYLKVLLQSTAKLALQYSNAIIFSPWDQIRIFYSTLFYSCLCIQESNGK